MTNALPPYSTILVTGASGFLGSWVCERAAEQFPGAQIIGVGRHAGHLAGCAKPNVTFVRCDMSDPSAYATLPAYVDAILHLAGDRRPDVPAAQWHEQMQANVGLTSQLADYAMRARARSLVYASSGAVYPRTECPPLREEVFGWPESHLGATKLSCEALLRARACAGQFAVIALRIFTAYGPRASASQFMSQAIGKLLSAEPLAQFGSPDVRRDWVFASDVAQAFVAALERLPQGEAYDVINIGSGCGTSIEDIVRHLARLLGVEKTLVFNRAVAVGAPAGDQWADVTRASQRLGWRPAVALADGLLRTVEAAVPGLSVGGRP